MFGERVQGIKMLFSYSRMVTHLDPLSLSLFPFFLLENRARTICFSQLNLQTKFSIVQLHSLCWQKNEPGSNYERATVEQAKRIMKPFVLRRLKKEASIFMTLP